MKKNKSFKFLVALCMLVVSLLCTTVLVGCGGKNKAAGKTYTYASIQSMPEDMPSDVKEMYNTMYKDATITVTSKELTLKVADTKQEMAVTKEGDKYILADEATERMNEISGMGDAAAEYYGIETETGFDVVIESGTSGDTFKIIISFKK